MLVYIYLLNRCLALKEDSKSGDTSRGDKLLSGDDVYPGALTERGRSLFSGRTKKWLVSQNVPRSVFLSFFGKVGDPHLPDPKSGWKLMLAWGLEKEGIQGKYEL